MLGTKDGSVFNSRFHSITFESKYIRNELKPTQGATATSHETESSGIHLSNTIKKRTRETGVRYHNMRSPVPRFKQPTAAQKEWNERINNLDYTPGSESAILDLDRLSRQLKNAKIRLRGVDRLLKLQAAGKVLDKYQWSGGERAGRVSRSSRLSDGVSGSHLAESP